MSLHFRVRIIDSDGRIRYSPTSAKTYPGGVLSTKYGDVVIKQGNQVVQLPLDRLLEVTMYALTNTDLSEQGDPREKFLKEVKAMIFADGFNPGGIRIVQL